MECRVWLAPASYTVGPESSQQSIKRFLFTMNLLAERELIRSDNQSAGVLFGPCIANALSTRAETNIQWEALSAGGSLGVVVHWQRCSGRLMISRAASQVVANDASIGTSMAFVAWMWDF